MKSLILISGFFLCLLMATNGQTVVWDSPQQVAGSNYGNLHPRIRTDRAGNPVILWGKTSSQSVYFSRMSSGNFTAPVTLNPVSQPAFTASWAGPDITSFGDTIYAVYKHTPEDTNHIYLTHSYDAGFTFSTPVRVDFIADSISRFPTVSTDQSGNPLVAFMKFDPGFINSRYVVSKSTDYGLSFSQDVLASGFSGGTVCDCCPASLINRNNKTLMLYRDNLNNVRTIWAGLSTDGGSNFLSGFEADPTGWVINACPATGPDGVLIGDSLFTVFMSAATGNSLVYLSSLDLSNPVFVSVIPLTGNFSGLSNQNYPRISQEGSSVGIVWPQSINGQGQLAFKFTQDIHTITTNTFDTIALGNIENADIHIYKDEIHVVWQDNASGTVWYRKGSITSTNNVNEIDKSVFAVAGNPVSANQLTIQTDANKNIFGIVRIQNSIGQILFQKSTELSPGTNTFSIPGLSQGIYLLSIESKDSLYQLKLSVDK